MSREITRTLIEVLNYETGEPINANEFFQKPLNEIHTYRSELQKAIEGLREKLFVCYYCKQLIRIRGGNSVPKKIAFHFAHLKDSDECHIKTQNQFTKEEYDAIKYNGAKESPLHILLKERIASCLKLNETAEKGISHVEVERTIKHRTEKKWRRPDINAIYLHKRIAIELQLSTTWLDVITKRQQFYKEQSIFMFWVFHNFNIDDDTRKLTINDVIYTNNQNGYVFDDDAQEKSRQENDLVLKCFYKNYKRYGTEIIESWEQTFIKLSDLIFDIKNYKIYYYDSEGQKAKLENENFEHQKALEEEKKLLREKKDLEEKLNPIKNRLQKKKEIYAAIGNYAEKIFDFFSGETLAKPLSDEVDLMKMFGEKYAKDLKADYDIYDGKSMDQFRLTNYYSKLKNLPLIEISGIKYAVLNQLQNWDSISIEKMRVKAINKNSIHNLFASDELIDVKSNYDLQNLKRNKDLLFLWDRNATEYLQLKDKNQKTIDELSDKIEKYKSEIKIELKKHFEEKISKLEEEKGELEIRLLELDIKLDANNRLLSEDYDWELTEQAD